MTLAKHLNKLEATYRTFANPLYSLDDYLAMGEAVWLEDNSEPKTLDQILAEDNLRLTSLDEAGWYFTYVKDGERISKWVTDNAST